jgi:hypothetical protein
MVMIATSVTIGWKFDTTGGILVIIFASTAVIDKKNPPVRVGFFYYHEIYLFLKTFAIVAPISAGV